MNEHFIDGGRVFCPVRRDDVDLDLCAGCEWSSAIDLAASPAFVRAPPDTPRWVTVALRMLAK